MIKPIIELKQKA
jgi:hypothetical protein